MDHEYHEFENKLYSGKSLVLDGKSFGNCKFKNCTLIYTGGNPPKLNGCSFDGCNWQFDDAAARTLTYFSGLYNGGFADLVEATFHDVRKGSTFVAFPPKDTGDKDSKAKKSSIFGFSSPRILKISKKR